MLKKTLRVLIPAALALASQMAFADCLSKFHKLMEKETNPDKLYALDAQFIECQKKEKSNQTPYVGNSVSGAAVSTLPRLAEFLKANQLVITSSESSCNSGKCVATAYITRASYPKHRPNDTGAFCGSQATWEAKEGAAKKWTASGGLAYAISSGNVSMALMTIDDKNKSYCR